MGKLNFPTTYRDDGLVGKLAEGRPLVTPPVQPGFPTTYREEGLMGKLALTSPPPIEKKVSWGSCAKDVRWLLHPPLPATSNLPHHL